MAAYIVHALGAVRRVVRHGGGLTREHSRSQPHPGRRITSQELHQSQIAEMLFEGLLVLKYQKFNQHHAFSQVSRPCLGWRILCFILSFSYHYHGAL
jgi:hypothetical protein